MPSPFPGMDPYVESQEWSDFRASFVPAIRKALIPRLAQGTRRASNDASASSTSKMSLLELLFPMRPSLNWMSGRQPATAARL